MPILHARHARRAGGSRTVPVLVAGDTVVADSTDIVAWADAQRPGTLLPSDPAERAEALALEDELDRQLGPATRRWGYFQMMPHGARFDAHLARGVPRWELALFQLTRPLAYGLMRRGMNITPEGAARSLAKIDEVFARIDARLADGRRFLVGDRFGVADLTFAALAAPVIFPREAPFGIGAPEDFDGDARACVERWRASPSGRFVLSLYAAERLTRPG
jgi:glutathione S-transferase